VPVLLNGERPQIKPPPRLGEHTRAVLEEIGFPALDVETLCER